MKQHRPRLERRSQTSPSCGLAAMTSLALLCLAGACKAPATSEAAPLPSAAAPASVAAASLERAAVADISVPTTLRLTGSLRADRETDLAANASGRVISTSVERGARIAPGQVLARLDVRALALSAREAEAQAQSVQAQTEQARAECERYEQLRKKGAVTDLEYDQKMTQCRTLPLTAEAASVRAQLAAQNVGDGLIRAPFAGLVTERYVEVGQYVRHDTRVVTIVSLEPPRLELSVPEADVAKVKEGAQVTFRVIAYPERRFTGTVRYLSGALRQATRDLVVEAVVEDPDRVLLSGMFADAEIEVGTRTLPSVPRSAVFERDGQPHAFFVGGDRLEERILSLGPAQGDRVSVLSGVRAGETVALASDLTALANGQRLR